MTALRPDEVDPRLPVVRWWTGLGRGQQALLAVVGLAALVNLSLSTVRSLTGGDPGGPASSSFSTGGDGLEGYADLVEAEGHPVARLRDGLGAADEPLDGTIVVVDPGPSVAGDVEQLARFVAGGGHLVLAGEGTTELLAGLTGAPVTWVGGAAVDRLDVWLAVASTGSARELAGDGGGRWEGLGPLVPVAGADGAAAVVIADVGEGRVTALADARPLQNAHLGEADNASLGLALAGPARSPVTFLEPARRSGRGLAAVPPGWKWAATGLAVTVALGLWSAGARAGPPEPRARALAPPRRDHVDAVAAGLDRVTPAGPLAPDPPDPPDHPGAHP